MTEEWDRASAEQKKIAEHPQAFDMEFDDFELIPAVGDSATVLANFDDGGSRLSTGGSFSYSWQNWNLRCSCPDTRNRDCENRRLTLVTIRL
ncbi:MAG TPA: hypothetical protein VMU05_13120 [Dongiaceae bacterium]|nr:hypothetical protein [Dongiaceae bacterium]